MDKLVREGHVVFGTGVFHREDEAWRFRTRCSLWMEHGIAQGTVEEALKKGLDPCHLCYNRPDKDAEIERLRAAHIDALQWVKRLNWIIGPDFDGSEDLRSTHKDVSNWLAVQRQAAPREG